MNKEWSHLNKTMQGQIGKKEKFEEGKATWIELRNQLMQTCISFLDDLSPEEFCMMPFAQANGYHNKTVAYSLWHIAWIEDIVAHTLIKGDEQLFFTGDYQRRMGAPLITTGNELRGEQISQFSRELDLQELYAYFRDVKESTEQLIAKLPYADMKTKIPEIRKEHLKALNVVSTDEKAAWLIDYWCEKDIRGLIRMPFSRHWIMHVEAALRIRDGIRYKAGKVKHEQM